MQPLDHPILVVDNEGNIAILEPAPGGPVRRIVATDGLWPVWNPRRKLIAFARLEASDGKLTTTVRTATLAGEDGRVLHRSSPGAPAIIGPRLPAYSLWSPSGDTLATVGTAAEQGLRLFLSDADASYTSDAVASGAPLFPAWSPDGQRLAVNAGGELFLVDLTTSPRVVSTFPGRVVGFRTPAWGPDGKDLVFALPANEGVRVVRSNPDGSDVQPLAELPGGVALGFRPHTRHLTIAMTAAPETGMFNRLWRIDLAAPDTPALLARGPFVSYHWSPTGERLTLLVPSQTGDGRYVLHSRLPDGTMAGVSDVIVPSQDYRSAIGFFDQYAVSHSFWSPDGRWFLVAGRLPGDAVSASFGDPAGDWVMRWGAGRGDALELVTPGSVGIFPWS